MKASTNKRNQALLTTQASELLSFWHTTLKRLCTRLWFLASRTMYVLLISLLKIWSSGFSRSAFNASQKAFKLSLIIFYFSPWTFANSASYLSAKVVVDFFLAFFSPKRGWLVPKPSEDLGRDFFPLVVISPGGRISDSGISYLGPGRLFKRVGLA